MQEFQTVALDVLVEHPHNPRRTFDPKQMEDLKRSVAEVGVLTPLLVRPLHNGKAGKLQIIAGARRFRVAAEVGLAEVPVRVRDLTDIQALELMTIENLQRADVHPLEEAEGYRALMAEAKYDVAKVAEKIGKSESYVYQRLKLCELSDVVKEAFLDGKITAGHAILIARLQPGDQEEALKTCLVQTWDDITDKKVIETRSVRALNAWIQQNIHLDLHGAPFKKDDAELLPEAGPCTTCPKRVGNVPALFPDVSKKDTCTDRSCFQAKLAAHVRRKQEQLQAENEGKPIPLVSSHWEPHDDESHKGVLGTKSYEVVGKGAARCESTGPAIVVEGDNVGRVIDVCTDSKCKKHKGRFNDRESRTDQKHREEQALAAKKEKAAKAARLATVDAILAKVKWPLTVDDARALAAVMFRQMGSYHSMPIIKRHEWGTSSYEVGGKVGKLIEAMSNTELARFLIEMTLLGEIPDLSGRYHLQKALMERYDVEAVKPERVAPRALPAPAKKGKGKDAA